MSTRPSVMQALRQGCRTFEEVAQATGKRPDVVRRILENYERDGRVLSEWRERAAEALGRPAPELGSAHSQGRARGRAEGLAEARRMVQDLEQRWRPRAEAEPFLSGLTRLRADLASRQAQATAYPDAPPEEQAT